MKVLVTGGAGYLGCSLVELLSADPNVDEIVVYDNLSRQNFSFFLGQKQAQSKIKFLKADILDSRTLKKALENTEVVFHLAAKATTPFADSQAELYEQVNHWGTAETVYAVEQSNVERFVFVSSASVYGSSMDEVDEQTTPNPKTIYGKSKYKAEKQVQRLANSKIKTFILRCGNVFGFNRSMRFDGVINRFMFDSVHSRLITINGDGEQYRSFISIERAASIAASLINSEINTGCYNLVDRSFTINEIADQMQAVFPELERVYINQDLQLNHLRVKNNASISGLTKVPQAPMAQYLADFLQRFTL